MMQEVRVVSRSALIIATLVLSAIATSSADVAAGDNPPVVGREAKDFELSALSDEKVKLSKLVEAGPVVLVVLRGYPGYQCPLCTKQFGEFLAKANEIKKTGATVVFVYPGPSEKLKDRAELFVKGKDYPDHFQILLDPDYTFTTAYGLRWDEKGETAFPSTFVIDGQRQVRFAAVSKTHGGRTKVEDVLKVLTAK